MIYEHGPMTRAAAAAPNAEPLTLDGFLASMRRVQRQLEDAAPSPTLGGLQVQESIYATKTEPVKPHKRRRNQREAYHRRIQKKWVKRWGTKQTPCAFLIDNAAVGMRGKTLVAHPKYVAALRLNASLSGQPCCIKTDAEK